MLFPYAKSSDPPNWEDTDGTPIYPCKLGDKGKDSGRWGILIGQMTLIYMILACKEACFETSLRLAWKMPLVSRSQLSLGLDEANR